MNRSPDCPFCKKLDAPESWVADDIVWEFPNSIALLGPWQFYTGYCVLISREHASELHHLGPKREAYLAEMTLLAEAIEQSFTPHKLNYELLGNVVPHLHWHIFPRYADDLERFKPVWLALERAETDPGEKTRLTTGRRSRVEIAQRLREWLTTHGAPKS